MTGINLNIQNTYTALYSESLTQTNSARTSTNAGTLAGSTDATASLGEKLTLSAEAIALSQLTPEQEPPAAETPDGGGEGIRPPETSTLGGGEGIRPPLTP